MPPKKKKKKKAAFKKTGSSKAPANTFVQQPQPSYQFSPAQNQPVTAPSNQALQAWKAANPPPYTAEEVAMANAVYGPGSLSNGPTAQALPIDPNYYASVAQALAEYKQLAADLEYKKNQAKYEYGFDDTSNPYNRAAMLQRAYQQGQKGTTNSMASQGQLYAGATTTALDEGTFQHGKSHDALRREYADYLHQLEQAKLQGVNQLGGAWSNAYGQMVTSGLAQTPAVPALPGAPALPAVQSSAPKKKKYKAPVNTFVKKPKKPKKWKPVKQL